MTTGIDRTEAARAVRERSGYRLSETALRRWESLGLLRSRGTGRSRVPALYSDVDVLRATCIAILRRAGFTLAEIAVTLYVEDQRSEGLCSKSLPKSSGCPPTHRAR